MAKKKAKKVINAESINDLKGAFTDKWGAGSIMELNDDFKLDCEVIPTQSMSLDKALGVGGYPRGRIVEIYGPEASGKTTLALHATASAQQLGGKVAFIDAEHALSPQLMSDMGINIGDVLISQPDCGEQALEMCELLVESNTVDLVVIDSVAALVPRAELEGDVNANSIGAQARMMSQFLRRIAPKVSKSNCVVIFINQIRHKIGVMFGSPETTPGGNAMKFYASVRLDIRRKQKIQEGDTVIGHDATVKVAKNKVAVPFKKCSVPIIYGTGIDSILDLIKNAEECEILQKSGNWYSYNDQKIGNGVVQAADFLKENPDIYMEVDTKTREELFGGDKNTSEDLSEEVVDEDDGLSEALEKLDGTE